MNIFQRALNRISEPSTWAGLGGLSVLFGLPPGVINSTAQFIAGIASLIAIVHPESQFDRVHAAPAPTPPPTPTAGPLPTGPFVIGPTGPMPSGPFVIGPTGAAHPVFIPMPAAPVAHDPFVIGGTAQRPTAPAPAPVQAPSGPAPVDPFVIGGTARK